MKKRIIQIKEILNNELNMKYFAQLLNIKNIYLLQSKIFYYKKSI